MWIKCKDKLPEEGKIVLARHNLGNWIYEEDQKNVNCVVVWLERGISQEERNKLPNDDDRKHWITPNDEDGNNEVAYSWHQFGPGHFFGQDIICWQYIEDCPKFDSSKWGRGF